MRCFIVFCQLNISLLALLKHFISYQKGQNNQMIENKLMNEINKKSSQRTDFSENEINELRTSLMQVNFVQLLFFFLLCCFVLHWMLNFQHSTLCGYFTWYTVKKLSYWLVSLTNKGWKIFCICLCSPLTQLCCMISINIPLMYQTAWELTGERY